MTGQSRAGSGQELAGELPARHRDLAVEPVEHRVDGAADQQRRGQRRDGIGSALRVVMQMAISRQRLRERLNGGLAVRDCTRAARHLGEQHPRPLRFVDQEPDHCAEDFPCQHVGGHSAGGGRGRRAHAQVDQLRGEIVHQRAGQRVEVGKTLVEVAFVELRLAAQVVDGDLAPATGRHEGERGIEQLLPAHP